MVGSGFPLEEQVLLSRHGAGETGMGQGFKNIKAMVGVRFPGSTSGEDPPCQCRRLKRSRFNPRVGKIPWRRAQQPTPVSLPGESHGHRSPAGYSP